MAAWRKGEKEEFAEVAAYNGLSQTYVPSFSPWENNSLS